MFRQMLQLFRGTDPLRSILEMFASMLDDAEWMYGQVLDIYAGNASPKEREQELFARDRQINATEREIRRRLVEYLTITMKPDVASCLVFMSVSKDAERVGDYIKNMYDVTLETQAEATTSAELDQAAQDLRNRGLPLFGTTRQAFLTSDGALADSALKEALELSNDAEAHVWKVAESSLSPKSAVAHALSARHLKRISRHLGNIATAVVQPVDWMNYADEPRSGDVEEPPKS